MSEVLDQTEEEQVIERIVRNQLEIKRLQEENDTLKAYFKERDNSYPAGTRREVGKFYVQISENTRIDDKLAKSVLSASEYNAVSNRVIDSQAARKRFMFKPDILNAITKKFDNRVEVGLR